MGLWTQELPVRCEEEEGLRGKAPRLQKEVTHHLTILTDHLEKKLLSTQDI